MTVIKRIKDKDAELVIFIQQLEVKEAELDSVTKRLKEKEGELVSVIQQLNAKDLELISFTEQYKELNTENQQLKVRLGSNDSFIKKSKAKDLELIKPNRLNKNTLKTKDALSNSIIKHIELRDGSKSENLIEELTHHLSAKDAELNAVSKRMKELVAVTQQIKARFGSL